MRKLLICDDDVAVTNYLMVFLMQTEKYESTIVNDSRDVPEILERETFDAIVLDMDMPHLSGMDILKLVKEKKIDTPVIILTGVSDVDLAVKALKLGAFDYLTKPVDDEFLLSTLDKSIQHRTLRTRIIQLPKQLTKEDLENKEVFDHVPTQDPKMIRLFHQIEKMAAGGLSVFIIGERGTGKNSLAQAIHSASPRKDMPFVAVDVAAHDSELFSAALFGQAQDWKGEEEKSGFLEEAANGTLFVNNIEEMSEAAQIRLNRVLQHNEYYSEGSTLIKKIDVRVIVASIHDLTVDEFNDFIIPDLLNHLILHSIVIPPLRKRPDDLLLIAEFALAQENQRTGKNIKGFAESYIEILKNYHFPGNLQELRDIIATSVINADNDMIGIETLSPYIRDKMTSDKSELTEFRPRKLTDVVREHILKTLEFFSQDVLRASEELGITPDEIDEKLK
ncbi:MAG: sigma-54 dependent transcriptional regulator [Planctomycetes bacterium]|nr:sigma-54 dependent transcriptional regulator [Planctomycetota bacterium]